MYSLIGISMMLAGAIIASFTLSLLLMLAWPALTRFASRMAPAAEARFWLGAGLAPVVGGCAVSLLFVGPGYVLFEPRHTDERIGLALAAVAGVSVLLFAAAMIRSGLLLYRSSRLTSLLKNSGTKLKLEGITAEAYEVPLASRLTTVFGVGQPTIFFSRAVLATLDEMELRSVVRHEQAHVNSRDNVRALLLEIASWLGGNPILTRALTSRWVEAAELAADDRAAVNANDAVNLMSALVKVARLRDGKLLTPALGCSFLPKASKFQLKRRVEYLRAIADGEQRESSGASRTRLVAALAALATIAALIAAGPAPMAWAHSALEVLVKL